MSLRSFFGLMSNGQWTGRLSKAGYDASDPGQPVSNLRWCSDLASFRLLASDESVIPATATSATTPPTWTYVTCPTITGTPLLLSVWTCSQYYFWVNVPPAALIYSPRFSSGLWFMGGATQAIDAYPDERVNMVNAGLAQKVRDATRIAFVHNNTVSVTVKWKLFEAR